jgi:hypothetical protein
MVDRATLRAVGVVSVVALVVVGVLWAGTILTTQPPTSSAGEAYPPTSELVPDPAPATGEVSLGDVDGSGTILIDDAHHNRHTDEDLRPLVNALSGAGYEVVLVTEGDDFERRLADADGYLVFDPKRTHLPGEARAVREFVDSGGHVAIFAEPSRAFFPGGNVNTSPNIERSRVAKLGSHLGVEFGTDYLLNLQRNEGNFKRVVASGTGPASDVDRAVLPTATTVQASGGTTLLETTGKTRLSAESTSTSHAVAVRRENVLAVGDASLLQDGTHRIADNEGFVELTARFLVAGNRTGHLTGVPAAFGPEITISYTNTDLLGPAQDLAATASTATSDASIRFRDAEPDRTDVLVTTYSFIDDTDLEAPVSVGRNFSGVDGHSIPRDGTAVVVTNRGGYDLVIAATDGQQAARAVEALKTSEIGTYLVDDDLAIFGQE